MPLQRDNAMPCTPANDNVFFLCVFFAKLGHIAHYNVKDKKSNTVKTQCRLCLAVKYFKASKLTYFCLVTICHALEREGGGEDGERREQEKESESERKRPSARVKLGAGE